MDKAKMARKPLRNMLTRSIVEVEAELTKDPKDDDLQGILMDKKDKLDSIEMELSELDMKVLEALLDAGVSDDVYEAEHQEIETFNDQLRTIKRRIRQATESTAKSVIVSSSSVSGDKKKTFRYPKIEMKKFSGNLTEYMGWWAQFEKIHLDDELDSVDKFQYLLQHTVEGSKARRLVEGYPQTATNYPKVIAAITDRYGDKVLLTELYVRQLARMVIANASKSNRPSLSTMYDELESSLRALESLGVTTDSSAAFLYPLVESSLPEDLLKVWQRSALSGYEDDGEDTPVDKRLSSLMKFLRKEVKGAERLSFVSAGLQVEQKERRRHSEHKVREDEQSTAASLFTSEGVKCVFCEKPHDSKDCSKGSHMSLQEKKSCVEKKRCCYVCLKPGHSAKKCRSFVKCVVCGKKHQTIMCPEVSSARQEKSGEQTSGQGRATASSSLAAVTCTNTVYLQTLRITLKGPKGTKLVRALIDTGSQNSYVLSSTASLLGFPVIRERQMIHAVFGGECGEAKQHSVHSVDILKERRKKSLRVQLINQDKICTTLPQVSSGAWQSELKRRGIVLSDCGPGPQEVEVLFGADLCPRLLKGHIEKIGSIAAIQTEFGWTILGKNEEKEEANIASLAVTSCLSTVDVDKLWRLDSLGIMDPITRATQEEEEDIAKQHFRKHVTRTDDGRYCIALPWSNGEQLLPCNKGIAFKRLESTTKKLKEIGKYDSYNELIELWLSEGLIERAELREEGCHYLPHRAVFKPESRTTPVRPVFDASCKSARHPSLNDCLHKGPNEVQLIPSVLLRFRRNPVGVVADIRKAYQMISVQEDDRRYLQFLWWTDKGKVMAFRHCRVVFGVNCSAFLLASVLEKHLEQCKEDEQETATTVRSSMYVDNLVCSLGSQEEVEKFRSKATYLLSTAKMELREWEWTAVESSRVGLATNSRCGLGLGSRGSHVDRIEESSVLGLKWNKVADTLSCDIPNDSANSDKTVTKRVVLSTVAKIFDPIGWCCPATLIPKMFLQESWSAKCSWDEQLPEETAKKFREWASHAKYLKLIEVPRYAFQNESTSKRFQLHTFTDASQNAYAAATFVRVEDNRGVNVQLLQARSKVAPLKSATIPRLELMGCLTGARLSRSTKEAFNGEIPQEFFWSDSSVALAWIKRNDNWGTFVGNRVKEILSLTSVESWRHVPGLMNPADLPSRGCGPKELWESRWWEGPEWLKGPIETWPSFPETVVEDDVAEEKRKTPTTVLINLTSAKPWYLRPSSFYWTNIRSLCFIRRYFAMLAKKTPPTGDLTVGEIMEAEEELFRLVQREVFPRDTCVIEGLRVSKVGGLYRVHTKILQREDSVAFRSPVLLPSHHPLTEQFIRDKHVACGHGGVQATMTNIREHVWIIKTRKTVKKVIGKCVICRRFAAKPLTTPVAPLPLNRVRDAKSFEVTGVDLAGPLHLKCGKKTWIVLFTCAVYRCVHLEVVESLSTEDFLLALERFVCRRGRPVTIYSDNGTNFVGANNLFLQINWKKVNEEAGVKRIQWIFNPPSAAWWGGFWERLIRMVKDQLKRMLGRKKLGLNELVSCLCCVESQVNGRPLTYVSEDQDDLVPLTPQMFLTELRETTVPEVTEMTGEKLRTAVKSLSKLKDELKSRFRKEYLAELVHRGKSGKVTVSVGDIVLVGNDLQKRMFWPMGRVLELLPGSDGQTRVARIRVKEGVLTRPLQRLYPLEVSSTEETVLSRTEEDGEDEEKIPEHQEQVVTRFGRRIKKPARFGSSS